MNCPVCTKELPVNFAGATCPFCNAALPPAVPGLEAAIPKPRVKWFRFFAILVAPLVLTIGVVQLSKGGDAATVVAVLGGMGSGMTCGSLIGLRLGQNPSTKLALSIVFAIIMTVVSIGMNCFGCLAGGYKLDLR
jgi:hypothetical protein